MKQVCSMMAGVVIEILVKPGDQVSDGTDVAILESMKMQLPVASSESGKVEEVQILELNEKNLVLLAAGRSDTMKLVRDK